MDTPAAAGGAPRPRSWFRPATVLPLVLVLALAAASAAVAYAHFRQAPRQLWTSAIHDRNAHYWLGLNFALDFRRADLLHFVSDLDGARVWPPLHGVLVGVVLAVAGPDYRLAVLPSLTAWAASALLAFLLGRRLAPRGGNLAGAAAALFVLASPAHHAFATDVMLESLGACLTLATLYAAVRLVQTGSVAAARGLALALTAGFLHKYNYWLLTVFALAAETIGARWRESLRSCAGLLALPATRSWLWRQLRHPLTYVAVPAAAIAGLIAWTGGTGLTLAGRAVSLRSAAMPLSVAYGCFVIRLAGWYLRRGRLWVAGLAPARRALVYGHVLPVMAWFLWPRRLGYFIWFANPATNTGESPRSDLWGGYLYYGGCLVRDYHVVAWAAWAAATLAAIAAAAAARRWLRPGAGVVLCLILFGALVTAHHPNRKSRFLHSWIAAVWVAAGVGLAHLAYGWSPPQLRRTRHALAAASVAGLAVAFLPGVFGTGHAPEGGPQAGRPTTLDVTDCYLGHLRPMNRPAILCNLPTKFLSGWTLFERFGRRIPLVTDVKGFGSSAEDNRRLLDAWLRTTESDAIVFVDVRPGSPFYEPVPGPDYGQLASLLPAQSVFASAGRWDLPACGCRVTLWRRESASPLAAR